MGRQTTALQAAPGAWRPHRGLRRWDMRVQYSRSRGTPTRVRPRRQVVLTSRTCRVVDLKGRRVREFLRYLVANDWRNSSSPARRSTPACSTSAAACSMISSSTSSRNRWFRVVVNAGTAIRISPGFRRAGRQFRHRGHRARRSGDARHPGTGSARQGPHSCSSPRMRRRRLRSNPSSAVSWGPGSSAPHRLHRWRTASRS